MTIAEVRQLVRELGAARAGHTVWYRGMSRFLGYRAYVGVVTEIAGLAYAEDNPLPEPYTARFLDNDELSEHARDDENDITGEFVAETRQRGDRCYGVFDGDRLVNYSFYARQPTPINDRLVMHFDGRYVYVFKSFTLRAYRGQRLHGIAMAQAVRKLHEEDGCRGIIAYVESTNYKSLRSGAHMGHREIGVIRHAMIAGKPRLVASPGCRAYGFAISLVA